MWCGVCPCVHNAAKSNSMSLEFGLLNAVWDAQLANEQKLLRGDFLCIVNQEIKENVVQSWKIVLCGWFQSLRESPKRAWSATSKAISHNPPVQEVMKMKARVQVKLTCSAADQVFNTSQWDSISATALSWRAASLVSHNVPFFEGLDFNTTQL